MNYKEIFDTLRHEFDEDTALLVTQMETIHLSLDPTKKELVDGSFKNRVVETFNIVLREDKIKFPEKYALAVKLWECVHDWVIGQCSNRQSKSFKELLKQSS